MSERRFKLGLVGARGYVGAELVKLLVTHPMISLDFVSSREWAGMPLCAQWPWYPHSKRFVGGCVGTLIRHGQGLAEIRIKPAQ